MPARTHVNLSVAFILVAVFVATPDAATSGGLPEQRATIQSYEVEQAAVPVLERAEIEVINHGLIWPVPIDQLSSGFGKREGSFHAGADWTPGRGSPIRAIAEGVVVESRRDRWGWGNHVVLEHTINGAKVRSLYAHMLAGSRTVKVGDQVKQGDILGKVGSTGKSTGDHLHFEIHIDGAPVDPIKWMKANGAEPYRA